MAEEDQQDDAPIEGGEEGEEGGKKKKRRLIIIIAVLILLLAGAGAGLYFSGILGGGEDTSGEHAEDGHGGDEEHGDGEEGHATDGEHGGGDEHAEDGHGGDDGHGEGGATGSSRFLEIPPMIVNLNTDDGTPRYLRLTIQLELANPSQAPAVQAVMPRVIDQFQTYLRELRIKDLRGSAGIYRLQMELLWRVNRAAAPVKVKDVLFQEILIQ